MSDRPFNRNQRVQQPERDPDAPPEDMGDAVVPLSQDNPEAGTYDPNDKTLHIPVEGGGVVVQFGATDPADAEDDEDQKFYANLAEKIDDHERRRIVEEVLRGIEADDQSRQEWLATRAEGIKMLGTTIEKAQADVGSSSGPLEGMSTVRHPLLLESIVRFQANAGAELYPPAGPVKVHDDRPVKPVGTLDNDPAPFSEEDEGLLADLPWIPPLPNSGGAGGAPALASLSTPPSREELAEALEKGFNHNLTVVDRGYRPDSVRMLFSVGFGGCAFKKVYDDPIKERPVSRFVDAADIIVSNSVSDHRDAGRITHRIVLRPALVRRMQIAGVYRDIKLHEPSFNPNAVEEATARAQGLDARPPRQEDQPRTLYESYVELDIAGYEHKRNGKPTGIPLPYKVTIDKDATELLELRRNWEEDDETQSARQIFVKFSFIPALGFYDLGLLHMLGNGDRALTGAWRIALDSGMFGNFPGFIYNEGAIRNWTNQNRVPPGGGIGIKGVGNLPLDQIIKPLPYKEVGPGLIALISAVEQRMDRVAGTTELPVGEGRQDAPVGTTLALIEQATKVLAAVHIGLHDSQAQELDLLKERYKQNPEAFWRWNKKARPWEKAEFLKALDDYELSPAADPNTWSHMIRLIKCQAVKTVAMMNPTLYDMKKVDQWIFEMIGVSDPEQFFAPPPDPNAQPPDPMLQATMATLQQKSEQVAAQDQQKAAELQQKGAEAGAEHQARMAEIEADAQMKAGEGQQKAREFALQSSDAAADRQSKERLEAMRIESDRAQQQDQHTHEVAQQTREHTHVAQQATPPKPGEPPGPGGGLALAPKPNPSPF